MRREILYLGDIVEATDAVARFIEGVEWEGFAGEELCGAALCCRNSS